MYREGTYSCPEGIVNMRIEILLLFSWHYILRGGGYLFAGCRR
jgi:hypothetical protein